MDGVHSSTAIGQQQEQSWIRQEAEAGVGGGGDGGGGGGYAPREMLQKAEFHERRRGKKRGEELACVCGGVTKRLSAAS